MIDMLVTTQGNVALNLQEVAKEFPSLTNYIVSEVSKGLAKFQKEGYLRGQYLNKKSGETYDSVRFFKMQNGVFGVRPGSGVVGRLNYLNVFVRGSDSRGRTFPQGDFITDSARAFFASKEVTKISGAIIQEYLYTKFMGEG